MATRVQTKSNGSAGANTISAVMDSNVTSGNKLVVLCKYQEDFSPSTSHISDTQGNTYTLDWSLATLVVDATTLADYAVYSCTVGSTAANTVTFNPAGGSTRIGIVVREYSGLGTHDGSTRNSTHASSTTTPTSGSFTPSAASGVIFAFISSSQTQTWEAEYGDATEEGNGHFHTAVDESVTAASQSADSTQSSTLCDCAAIWYQDGAVAGASPKAPGTQFVRGRKAQKRRRAA